INPMSYSSVDARLNSYQVGPVKGLFITGVNGLARVGDFMIAQKIFVSFLIGGICERGFKIAQNQKLYIEQPLTLVV
ncbi:hypothetical protein, partial [Methanoregula sp.]|uniref:hypothetical protein n=1 Tax=Methanoregula sp. TaxID=2052170 RepID=UPI000CA8FA8F